MKKFLKLFSLVLTSFLMCFLTACGSFTITCVGSTTVLVPMESISYNYYHATNVKVSVNGGGSATGITFAERRLADFGMVSRYPKKSEYNNSTWNDLATMSIGYDVIAFPVNLHGTGYTINVGKHLVLKWQDLYNIYDNKFTNWTSIAAKSYSNLVKTGTGNGAIKVVSREDGSGTQASFYEAFNKVYDPQNRINSGNLPPNVLIANSNGNVINYVANTDGSIGYCSSFVLQSALNQKTTYPNLISTNFETNGNIIIDLSTKQGRETVYKYGISPKYNFQPNSYAFWHPLNLIIDSNSNKKAALVAFMTYVVEKEEPLITRDYLSLLHDNTYNIFGRSFANNPSGVRQLIKFMFTPDHSKTNQNGKKIDFKKVWHW